MRRVRMQGGVLRAATLLAVALGFLLAVPPLAPAAGQTAGSQPALPSTELSDTFDELVGLIQSEEWTGSDWARASYLAMRLSRFGSPGVPSMRNHFARAASPEEAILAGIYLAVHGQNTDHMFVRKELETNQRKRVWLQGMLGNRDAINTSLRAGAKWTPAIRLIPSLGGCRNLCRVCLQSQDALVRRAGLYWGYWIADGGYWKAAQKCADEDPDALTRKLAQHLLRQRPAAR